jgi:hypothetical protein
VAETPRKRTKKSVLKFPNKPSAKASSEKTSVQKSDSEDIATGVPLAGKAPKAVKVTKSRTGSPENSSDVQLPNFDPTTDWSTAPWVYDPALLVKVRAAMIPETISYPEALPDIGRATLFRFEAGHNLVSEVAPLEEGAIYALATRRDGTFLLYRES